jgi:hypothetical protein
MLLVRSCAETPLLSGRKRLILFAPKFLPLDAHKELSLLKNQMVENG